jgi:phosphatidylglycerophosphate synthase
MLFRDYTVTGLRQFAQLRGVVIMADKVAKLKANFLYATLFYGLLISFLREIVTHATVMLVLNIILYVLVAVTSILIIVSLIDYIFVTIKNTKGKKELKFESNKI